MSLPIEVLKSVFRSFFSVTAAADKARVDHALAGREVYTEVTDGGTAGTAAAERDIYIAKYAGEVKEFQVSTPVTAAIDATNTSTFTLSKKTAGGSSTIIGTITNGTVAMTAFTPRSSTLVAGTTLLAAGDTLTIKLAKASSGTAIGSATAAALVRVLVEEGGV